MKAMILAAGEGRRMRPLTNNMPKPLLKINGKPIIAYHIDRLIAAGYEELVINVSYLGDQVEAVVNGLLPPGVSVQFSREARPLETGGGIFKALPLLGDEPFVIINGDVWTDYPLQQLALSENELAHLVMVDNPDHNLKGDFAFLDSSQSRPADGSTYGLLKECDGNCYTYAGIAVIAPKLFAGCSAGKFPLPKLFRQAMAQHKLSGELYRGEWLDIGTPQRLEEINRRLAG